MKTVSFVMAMEGEAKALITKLGLRKISVSGPLSKTPMQFFDSSTGPYRITLTLPGLDPRFHKDSIGTEPATAAAMATICEFKPDLLINAGTAGGFASHGAKVAEVYLSDSEFFYHDRHVSIAGWDQMSRGGYPSINVQELATRLGLKTANVTSGNSLDFTQAEIERIRASGAGLKEMEAAGIAWAAWLTQTPFFAIKSVTNLIDTHPDSPTEFTRNFDSAVDSLTRAVLEVVKALPETNLL